MTAVLVEAEATVADAVAAHPAPNRVESLVVIGVQCYFLQPLLSFVTGPLTGLIEPLLTDYFSPVDQIFENFHGNPVAIAQAASGYDDAGDKLSEAEENLHQIIKQSRQVWTGAAADAFREKASQLADLYGTVAQSQHSLAGGQLGAAANLAVTKSQMIMVAGELQLATISLISQLGGVILEMAARSVIEFIRHFGQSKEQFMENMIFEFAQVLDRFYRPVFTHLTQLEKTVCADAGKILGDMAGLGLVLSQVAGWLNSNQVTNPGDGSTGYAASEAGTTPRPGDMDVVSLMDAAGSGDPSKIPPGWSPVTDPGELAKLGLTPAMLDQSNGMQVNVYRDAQGRYVVCFPGTDFGDKRDVDEDFMGGGGIPAQTRAAIDIGNRIAASGHGGDVVYGGHSLGGRLASVAALAQGGTAVTYNPAGVDDATIEYIAAQRGITADQVRAEAAANQRNYISEGEILDRVQTQDPTTRASVPDNPGTRIVVPSSNPNMTGVERHTDYDYFKQDLKDTYPDVFN